MTDQYYQEDSQATTILVLGILSLVVCQILGPIAWVMGNNELAGIDAGRRPPQNRGTAQAGRAAERIAPLSPAAVYASPMERTRETAAPIARASGNRVRTARGLIECDFGEWTGRKLSALRRTTEWTAVQSTPSGFPLVVDPVRPIAIVSSAREDPRAEQPPE